MRTSFLRVVAVGEIFFFLSSLVSPLAEANLWEERRAAQEKSRPVQLASAVLIGSQISGQLPAAAPVAMRRPEIAAPLQTEQSGGALAVTVAAIPQNRVSIREVSYRGAGAPVVVVLQDVHLNPEAQGNLSEAIQSLASVGGVRRVGVEGAFTPFDLRRVNGFPDAGLSHRVADNFLAATLIAAPSHAAAVLRRSDVEFIGVDSRPDYDANVAAYRGSRSQDAEMRTRVAALKGALSGVKARLYSPEMAKLDRLFAGHESGSVPLGIYLKQLAALSGSSGPNVDRLVEAYALETSLDFARVDRERKAALERLLAALSASDLKSLLDRTLAFRTGKVSAPAFYEHLRALCSEHGVPLTAYSALDRYVRYVTLADAIDAESLASEQDGLEEAAVIRATKSEDERAAAIVDRRLALVGRLIDFALTPREWQLVDRDSAVIAGVPVEIGRLAGQPQTAFALNNFLDFYRCADKRSETIVSRLLEGSKGTSALVVGGFHTPHLVSMLRARGCSVVVCSPKLTRVNGSGTDYLTIFSREKTPLEKLFAGEKLTLAPTSVNFTDLATMNRLVTEEAAEMVELGVAGRPPSGITASLEDRLAHVTVEGTAGSAPVDVYAGRTDEAAGFEPVGKRIGSPGSYFVRSVRQAGLLRTLLQITVDIGTNKTFLKRTAGAVVLGIAGGVTLGTVSSGLYIAAAAGFALLVLGVLGIWRRADIAGLIRTVEGQPLAAVPGVTRLALPPAEGEREGIFFRLTDNRVRYDASRRVVQVNEGEMVIMQLAEGEDGSLVSEASEGSTVLHIRSENSRGEALIAQLIIRAGKENLMAVTEGLIKFRDRAVALGFSAPEVTVSWNPRLSLAGTRAQRALTGELRSAIRYANSTTFRYNVKAIDDRTGRLSSIVGRMESARISADVRPTFPKLRWTQNEWDKGPQTALSRALNGMVWALPAAMFALFAPLSINHLVFSIVTFVVLVTFAAVLLPMASRSVSTNGLDLMAPTESRSLPTEAEALSLDYLVLAPTAGEGERLREMILETFRQGYLDRVIYINDGERPVSRDGKVVPHDLPILKDIKENGIQGAGLTTDENDRLKRQLNYISFPENQRKERAVRSTLYFLSYLYNGRLPKVTIIQDSDSFLIGDRVRAQLQTGAGQLINSQHVAMGVPIDGDVSANSGLLAWGEALGWWIQGYIRPVFFFLDRFALVRKVLSRSVPGGMAFFKTDRLVDALERHSGNFEAGDVELSNLLVEADKEEDPNAKPIADLFKGVRLRTDLMATAGDIVRQKTRWLNALFDRDPAAFLGIMAMLAWAIASVFVVVPLWVLTLMALVSVAPGVLTRLLNGPFRSMSLLTKLLIIPSLPIAVLSVMYTGIGGYYVALLLTLTAVNLIRRPALKAGWTNPMTLASIPFIWVVAGVQVLGFGVALVRGSIKRLLHPELFRAPVNLGSSVSPPSSTTPSADAPSSSPWRDLLRRIGIGGLLLVGFFGFPATASGTSFRSTFMAQASSVVPPSVSAAMPVFSLALIIVFGAVMILNVGLALARPGKLTRGDLFRRVVRDPILENAAIVGLSTLLVMGITWMGVFSSPFVVTLIGYAIVGVLFTLGPTLLGRAIGRKVSFKPVPALIALYTSFSVIFLQFENLWISFSLVFLMHGPAWNLLRMAVKAVFRVDSDWFPLASVASSLARPETAEAEVAGRLVAGIQKGSEAEALAAMVQILTDGTTPNVAVGQTTQEKAPLATLDPMKVALAVAAELKAGRISHEKAAPAIDLIAALLAIRASTKTNMFQLDNPQLMGTVDPGTETREIASPMEIYKWLDPAPGKTVGDAVKAFAEWRSQERRAGDQLVLVAPTGQTKAVQNAIDAAGLGAQVRVVDGSLTTNARNLLETGAREGETRDLGALVGTRRFRFLVRNDVPLSPAFFDLAAAGVDANVAGSLRSKMEIYLIVAAISQAVRIEPDMLSTFETLRTVMIQA